MQHVSQLTFPAATPPTDGGVAGVIAWVAGLAIAALGFIFWLRERSLKATVDRERELNADLKVENGKLEVKNEALQKENRELRDARFADAQKQGEVNKWAADRFMRYERRAAASERPGATLVQEHDEDDWANIPTGIANAMVERPAQAQARALPRPQTIDQSRPARPAGAVEEYRPRKPSRHDR